MVLGTTPAAFMLSKMRHALRSSPARQKRLMSAVYVVRHGVRPASSMRCSTVSASAAHAPRPHAMMAMLYVQTMPAPCTGCVR